MRNDEVIECVNSLLAAGELPGLFEPQARNCCACCGSGCCCCGVNSLLFEPQELEPLLAPLKEEMGKSGFKYRSLYDFFVSRLQRCANSYRSHFIM